MLKWLVLGLVAACFWVSVMTKGSGPPTSACVSMEPSHTGITKQTSTSPYTLDVDKTEVKAGDTDGITVTVKVGELKFQGLFVQARVADSDTPVGTFEYSHDDLKTIQCTNANDAIGHSSSVDKGEKSFKWIPPSTQQTQKIKFRATVAQTKEKYWLAVESEEVTVNKPANEQTSTVSSEQPTPTETVVKTTTDGSVSMTTMASMFLLPVFTIFIIFKFF